MGYGILIGQTVQNPINSPEIQWLFFLKDLRMYEMTLENLTIGSYTNKAKQTQTYFLSSKEIQQREAQENQDHEVNKFSLYKHSEEFVSLQPKPHQLMISVFLVVVENAHRYLILVQVFANNEHLINSAFINIKTKMI